MKRRTFLTKTSGLLGLPLLNGLSMKRNIKHFGKTFEYLKNPDLRTKETGDALLTVEGAEISGTTFSRLVWRNIRFINCDFVGGYEIDLDDLEQCVFENCRFAGIIGWGTQSDVRFVRCEYKHPSIVLDSKGSTGVRFEQCTYIGQGYDRNHWGSFGSRGEATFVGCTVKLTGLSGDQKLTLKDCNLAEVDIQTSGPGGGGPNFPYCELSIEGCKLTGLTDLQPGYFTNITIRDTSFEHLNLQNATIKGDVLLERVKGGFARFSIYKGAQSFTLRDSTILGNTDADSDIQITVYAGAFKRVLVENVQFSENTTSPWAGIGGGYKIDNQSPQPVMTETVVFRNVKGANFRSAGLNAGSVLIDRCQFARLKMSDSKINDLTIRNTSISLLFDAHGTRVSGKQYNGLSAPKRITGRIENYEDSNVQRSGVNDS